MTRSVRTASPQDHSFYQTNCLKKLIRVDQGHQVQKTRKAPEVDRCQWKLEEFELVGIRGFLLTLVQFRVEFLIHFLHLLVDSSLPQ